MVHSENVIQLSFPVSMIFVNDLDLPLLKSISLSNALQGYDSESNLRRTSPNNRITLVMKSEIDHYP